MIVRISRTEKIEYEGKYYMLFKDRIYDLEDEILKLLKNKPFPSKMKKGEFLFGREKEEKEEKKVVKKIRRSKKWQE